MAPDAAALESLETLVQTACALLQQLQDVLTEIRRSPPSSTPTPSSSAITASPLDALALARDSASLIRAHATKISLLLINSPFTPSALSSVLRELVAGPVPGLVASVQACDPDAYTLVFRNELAWRCQHLLAQLEDLLQRIPKDGKVLRKETEGFGGVNGKGSIAATGTLWAACDKVGGLADGGVGGFFVDKMNEWKDTLNDIMEEMKEWGEEEPDDEDENDDDEDEDEVDDLADQVDSTHISTQNILDDLMNSHRTIPATDPDRIRPRLESSLRRLRLVILLYQAITKRRMKKLPSFPPPPQTTTTTTTNDNKISEGDKVPRRLDELSILLQKLPDRFGDLACAFYELRPNAIDEAMDQCFLDAFAVSELLGEGWDGQRDGFTEWTDKFQREIKKA